MSDCICILEQRAMGRAEPLACSQCGRGNPTIRPNPKGGNMAAKKKKASKAKKPKAQNITEATGPGETITILEPLDDPELVALKRTEIADLSMQIQELEDEKRAKSAVFSVKIKELKEERKERFEEVSTLTQKVEVEVNEIPDIRLGRMIYARRDTGKMVGERAMTAEEREQHSKQIDWVNAQAARDAVNDANDDKAEAAAQ